MPRYERVIAKLLECLSQVSQHTEGSDPGLLRELETRIAQLDAVTFAGLDASLRRLPFRYDTAAAWNCLRPEDLPGWNRCRPLLRIATCSASGFVRARAVELLAEHPLPGDLAFLLLRTTDWVGPVRDRAVIAARALILDAWAHEWTKALPLLGLLERRQRSTSELGREARAFLVSPLQRDALRVGIRSPDRGIVRACAALLTGESALDEETLLELRRLALSVNASVATKVARWLLAHDSRIGSQPLLPLLLEAPASTVRIAALEAVAADGNCTERVSALRSALMDKATAVRETARHLLRKAGEAHGAATYRAVLLAPASPARCAIALRGLYECGSIDDAALVSPFLEAESPLVRTEAVRTLAKHAAPETNTELLKALEDSNRRVALASAVALLRRDVDLPSSWLSRHLGPAGHPTEAKLIAGSIKGNPYWAALVALASAAERAGPRQQETFLAHLRNRLASRAPNRPPTDEQREALARACTSPVLTSLRPRLQAELNVWHFDPEPVVNGVVDERAPLLVLDLDETLVHASDVPLHRPCDARIADCYVYARPGLRTFLETVAANYPRGLDLVVGALCRRDRAHLHGTGSVALRLVSAPLHPSSGLRPGERRSA